MRILVTALAIVLTTASVNAQGVAGVGDTGGAGGGGFGGRHQQRDKSAKTEAPKPKVDEKAYDAALKTIPNKPSDAWSGVR
jgi:hypothetical protein